MEKLIQSLHVKRFKGIKDAPFDVANINVFIGANNAGKSTIAQLLHFAIGIFQAIELAGRWGNQKTVGLSLAPQELLYSPCSDLYSLGSGGQLAEDKNSAIEFTITLASGQQTRLSIRRGRNGNIRVEVDDAPIAKTLASVVKPYTIFSPGLAGIAKSETFISNGVLLRTIARGDANLVLRNILHRIHKAGGAGTWLEFTDDLSRLFGNVKIEVDYNEATDEHIHVQVDMGSGAVPIELAGTGVLQAVQILGYIHHFHPSAIILDEPDSHLHPNNQRLLCKLLQGVAEERDTQVFLTTHSRHVVDALSGQARFLWVRQGTVAPVEQDHDLAVLLDIGALDVKEMVATSHANCIVLTEDSLKRNLEILLESSGFDMNSTLTLAYHGCTSPHNLRPLIDLIRSSNQKAKIVVHRDRDYLTDEEAKSWHESIRNLKVESFLTVGVDIESHFLNPEHLAILNHTSAEEMRQLIDTATTECDSESLEKYANGRADIIKKKGEFGKINIGQIAVDGPKQLKSDPKRYRHAKTVVKKLRGLFRESTKLNLRIFEASTAIGDQTLNTIAKKTTKQ